MCDEYKMLPLDVVLTKLLRFIRRYGARESFRELIQLAIERGLLTKAIDGSIELTDEGRRFLNRDHDPGPALNP